MKKITKMSIVKHAKHVTTTKVSKKEGNLTIAQKKEISVKEIFKLAIETNSKCYMLSFNTPDKRKYSLNDIIAELLKNGYLYNGNVEYVLTHSILFLSSYNLSPLQKFINSKFKDLKFVLVRLNRGTFPKLRYCY